MNSVDDCKAKKTRKRPPDQELNLGLRGSGGGKRRPNNQRPPYARRASYRASLGAPKVEVVFPTTHWCDGWTPLQSLKRQLAYIPGTCIGGERGVVKNKPLIACASRSRSTSSSEFSHSRHRPPFGCAPLVPTACDGGLDRP